MTPHALLFTVAAIGISEMVYLIRKRIALEKPICPLGEECTTVLNSKYNKLFGIHNDILGFLFYVAISLITAFLVVGVQPVAWWDLLAKVLITGGVLFSLFLLFLQWRVIKAWCFWCVLSSITIFVMAIIELTSNLLIILA